MFHFLVLLSLLTSIAYRVVAVTLDASLLTQLGYNTKSYGIYVDRENITDIDPNAFKGYTQVNYIGLQMNLISKLDLEVFKELVNLRQVFLSYNPLTQLTNVKKLTFPQITSFYLNDCQLKSVDTDVINGLPNLMYFDVERCYLNDPLKPNQFSAWKKLNSLTITTKNQVTLNKTHLNGINSLSAFAFTYSNIKTVQVRRFCRFQTSLLSTCLTMH
jgi:Leucine-rich repeat (LRR) protein